MAGFGPAAGQYAGASDPSQRLQYYSSQHTHTSSNVPKDLPAGRRAGKVKFFDTQKVNSLQPALDEFRLIAEIVGAPRDMASSTTIEQKTLAMKKVCLVDRGWQLHDPD